MREIPESHVENMLQLAYVSACTKELSSKVSSVLQDDRVCVTIGGDHSIGVGNVFDQSYIMPHANFFSFKFYYVLNFDFYVSKNYLQALLMDIIIMTRMSLFYGLMHTPI